MIDMSRHVRTGTAKGLAGVGSSDAVGADA